MTEEQGAAVQARVREISRAYNVPVSGVLLMLGNVRGDVSVTCAPGHLRRLIGLRRYLAPAEAQQSLRRACERLSEWVDGLV